VHPNTLRNRIQFRRVFGSEVRLAALAGRDTIAVVHPQGAFGSKAAREVRASTPLGKSLGESSENLTDPARLWTK